MRTPGDKEPTSGLFARRTVRARAPGRANLIGEHIDYLGGTVLPIAIPLEVRVTLSPRPGRTHLFSSSQFPETGTVEVEGIGTDVHGPARTGETGEGAGPTPPARQSDPRFQWVNYSLGVFHQFVMGGIEVPPLRIEVESDLPVGSGLSSSAALEIATATALNEMTGAGFSCRELARMAWRAETGFVGVSCGMLDQAASALCRADHALALTCSDLTIDYIRMPDEVGFVVAHCGVARQLAETKYQERREECARALEVINRAAKGDRRGRRSHTTQSHTTQSHTAQSHTTQSHTDDSRPYRWLCSVPRPVFDSFQVVLSPTERNRAQYALTEKERVEEFIGMICAADFQRAGQLMNESHFGLRDLYEVSCSELDELTEFIRNLEGVYGSRLTGAGFGGCTISLVERRYGEQVVEQIRNQFSRKSSRQFPVFFCRPCDGASVL